MSSSPNQKSKKRHGSSAKKKHTRADHGGSLNQTKENHQQDGQRQKTSIDSTDPAFESRRPPSASRTLYDPNAPKQVRAADSLSSSPRHKFHLHKSRESSKESLSTGQPDQQKFSTPSRNTAVSTSRSNFVKLRPVFDDTSESQTITTEYDNPVHSLEPKRKDLTLGHETRGLLERILKREKEIKSAPPSLSQIPSQLEVIHQYQQILHLDENSFLSQDMESRCWKYGVYTVISEMRHNMKINSLDAGMRDIFRQFLLEVIEIYTDMENTFALYRSHDPKKETGHRTLSFLGDLNRYFAQMCAQSRNEKQVFSDSANQWYRKAIHASPGQGLYVNQLAVTFSSHKDYLSAIEYYLLALVSQKPFQSAYETLCLLIKRLKDSSNRENTGLKITKDKKFYLFLTILEILVSHVDVDDLDSHVGFFANVASKDGNTCDHIETTIFSMIRILTISVVFLWQKKDSLSHHVKNVLLEGGTKTIGKLLDILYSNSTLTLAEDSLNTDEHEKEQLAKYEHHQHDFDMALEWICVWWISCPKDLCTVPTKQFSLTMGQSSQSAFIRHLKSSAASSSVPKQGFEKDKIYLQELDDLRKGIAFFETEYITSEKFTGASLTKRLQFCAQLCLEMLCECEFLMFDSNSQEYYPAHHRQPPPPLHPIAGKQREIVQQNQERPPAFRSGSMLFDSFEENVADLKGETEEELIDLEDLNLNEIEKPPIVTPGSTSSKQEQPKQEEVGAPSVVQEESDSQDEYTTHSQNTRDGEAIEIDPELFALRQRKQELETMMTSLKGSQFSSKVHSNIRDFKQRSQKKHNDSSFVVNIVFGKTILVLDTNIWISKLSKIQTLYESKGYKLWIPLGVMTELRSLASDSVDANTTRDQEEEKQSALIADARKAVDWIAEQFTTTSNQNLISIRTLKGNALPVGLINAKEEYHEQYRTMDDVILATCQKLQEMICHSSTSGSSTTANIIFVSEDTNLRLKAHALGIPVLRSLTKIPLS